MKSCAVKITTEKLNDLQLWLTNQKEVFGFFENQERSSLLISYLIQLELSGPNNNLARHLRCGQAREAVDPSKFFPEVIAVNGLYSAEVSWPTSVQVEVTYPALLDIIDQKESSIVITPTKIAQIIQEQGIEPVIVRSWLMETLFGSFNPANMKYRDQMWELENNDVLLYAQLVADKKMVFQGIHDVVEHAPGIRCEGWQFASEIAQEMSSKLQSYFDGTKSGNIPSHLPPYLAGIILDDLTQSRSYHSVGRVSVIRELIDELAKSSFRASEPWILKDLPDSLDAIMDLARTPNIQNDYPAIKSTVGQFFEELKKHSYLAIETTFQ